MKDLHFTATTSTPDVDANWEAGRLRMGGDSYPENSFDIFQPVIDWLESFLTTETRPILLELSLVYLNTSSVRVLMDMLDILEEAHQGGRGVEVVWLCNENNERVGELAEEFKEDCTFPFHIRAE